MNGLLLVDKPKEWTSFDVVAKVRGVLRASLKAQGLPYKIKVGHTGTLDPLATGLLVLAIGSYTKKVNELTAHSKSYDAQVTLGATSITNDAEGELVQSSTAQPTLQQVTEALQSYVGTIQQVPPQFSAIKVGGVRSYAVARKGGELKLEPRTVTIHSISNIAYSYPVLTFTAHVGSGTYIRSLARDIGEKLGTGAYLSNLRRTEVGAYKIVDAITTDLLTAENIAQKIIA